MIADDPDILKYVGKEHHIVVANHKYDIDWVALWILAERVQMLGVSDSCLCIRSTLTIFFLPCGATFV